MVGNVSETVARMDAGPEPTGTYLRRVSDTFPIIHVVSRYATFQNRFWYEFERISI